MTAVIYILVPSPVSRLGRRGLGTKMTSLYAKGCRVLRPRAKAPPPRRPEKGLWERESGFPSVVSDSVNSNT